METEALTGCPFCGGEPTIRPTAFRTFQGCCDCGGSGPPGRTREEAVANFNRRASGWVPVSERLPADDGQYVLAVFRSYDDPERPSVVGFAIYQPEDEGGWLFTSDDYGKVTHWMPLPTPPSPAGEPGDGDE